MDNSDNNVITIRPVLGTPDQYFNPADGYDWFTRPIDSEFNMAKFMAKTVGGALGSAWAGSESIKALRDAPVSETGANGSSSDPLINSTMPTPSELTKRTPQVEIQTDAKRKKTSVKVSSSAGNKTIAGSLLSGQATYYDSNLLINAGEKRLTKLSVKLGRQLYPDVITPFLQNLQQHGQIRMQFAGRIVTAKGGGKRHTHIQMFRHRLSANATFNETVAGDMQQNLYPVDYGDNILFPKNTTKFYVDGASTAAGTYFPEGTTPFRDIYDTQTYWAPYNLADLEDCSWNLNKLKLLPQFWAGLQPTTLEQITPHIDPIAILGLANDVQPFATSSHYRSSRLAYNNSLIATQPSGTSPWVDNFPSTYKYKAVINKGSISYDFMNKGTGGAKVELIIYRVKKGQALDWKIITSSPDFSFANNLISNAIGQGYIDTCLAKQGTDNLGGRPPEIADVLSNAAYPLLPNLRATKQGNLPFAEVSRQTFAMPSGSRREVNIQLPGICYDPRNQPMLKLGAAQLDGTNTHPSMFDEYSYAVMIAVSGVVCTDEMNSTTTAGSHNTYNVGDMISRADVQFYATYSESIGACSYKPDNKPIMYSAGTMIENKITSTVGGSIVETPVTMLPQTAAVRIPGFASGEPGTNLTFDINAAGN